MNDNKTADEFREEELFRKFLEKHKSESSGGDVDWWALSTDDSKEPETADDSAQKSGEYPDFDLDEASAQAYGEDEGAPDNEEWHSEYEGDKIIEKFADVLPEEELFSEEDKGMSLFKKIKHVLKFAAKKANCCHLVCMIIPGILLLLLLLNIVTPSKGVSQKENRTLAQFPKISLSTITDGTFMKEFETFITDQFVFRNQFVSTKRRVEMLSGKRENHEVLLCDEGYLIENTSSLTKANIKSNLKAIEDLASLKRYDITLAVLPTAYEIMDHTLPAFAYVDEYGAFYDTVKENIKSKDIKVADIGAYLKKNRDKYLYYRTDHHQTAHGSFYSYTALGDYLDYEPHDAKDFKVDKVASEFYGTMWSNSGFAGADPDDIYRYTLKDSYKHEVSYPSDGGKMNSLYDDSMLRGKDKYAYYLGGNHALTVIKSDCPSKKRLAVIKDSYAHSIVPFLANHYGEIYMIDLRYYNDDVLEYLYNSGVKEVLVLYNQNTFMTDTNLSKISTFVETSPYNVVPNAEFGILPELDPVDDSYFDDAVFVGDSLTIGIEYFSGFNSLFLCAGGLSTQTLETQKLSDGKTAIEIINEAEHLGKLYIMLGMNESIYEKPDEFIERYSSFIDAVRERFPNILVYVESITPVSRNFENSKTLKNRMINSYNEHLLKMVKEKDCYYVDLNSYFADEDGYLPEGAGGDGVHFSPDNYRKLAEYLKNHAVATVESVKGLSSAGSFKGEGKYDTGKIAQNIIKEIKFKDKLSEVSDALVISNYKVDKSKVCDATLYMGGGSTAEEVAVFELVDEEYAKQVTELAQKRIDNKKKDFENYIPAEMKKLNNPVIVRKGKVVAVCIADNATKEQIEKCIK